MLLGDAGTALLLLLRVGQPRRDLRLQRELGTDGEGAQGTATRTSRRDLGASVAALLLLI